MFFKRTNPKLSALQTQIDNTLSQMESHDSDSAEYDKLLNQLERLYKLLSQNKEGRTVSPDALVAVAGNLAGILLIVNYERLHVVTSKALSFVVKSKI